MVYDNRYIVLVCWRVKISRRLDRITWRSYRVKQCALEIAQSRDLISESRALVVKQSRCQFETTRLHPFGRPALAGVRSEGPLCKRDDPCFDRMSTYMYNTCMQRFTQLANCNQLKQSDEMRKSPIVHVMDDIPR